MTSIFSYDAVGQSLSIRPDIIGLENCEVSPFVELHERVPAFPIEDAMKITEGDFGYPVSHIFSYILVLPLDRLLGDGRVAPHPDHLPACSPYHIPCSDSLSNGTSAALLLIEYFRCRPCTKEQDAVHA